MTEIRTLLFNGESELIRGVLTSPRNITYQLTISKTENVEFVMSVPDINGHLVPEKTSLFAIKSNTDICINGDEGYYYTSNLFYLKRRAMTNGEKYGLQNDGATVSISKTVPYQMSVSWNGYAQFAFNAISGSKLLLQNGTYGNFVDSLVPDPRTVLGWNNNATKIYFLTIDGRSTLSGGMTLKESADLIKAYGATFAINLDGGGSSTQVIKLNEVQTIINHPSDYNGERLVANKIGIRFKNTGGQMSYWEVKNTDQTATRTIRTSYGVTYPRIPIDNVAPDESKLFYGKIAKAGVLAEDKYTYTQNVPNGSGGYYALTGDVWLKLFENDGKAIVGWIAEKHLGTMMISKTLIEDPDPDPTPEPEFPISVWVSMTADGEKREYRLVE